MYNLENSLVTNFLLRFNLEIIKMVENNQYHSRQITLQTAKRRKRSDNGEGLISRLQDIVYMGRFKNLCFILLVEFHELLFVQPPVQLGRQFLIERTIFYLNPQQNHFNSQQNLELNKPCKLYNPFESTRVKTVAKVHIFSERTSN